LSASFEPPRFVQTIDTATSPPRLSSSGAGLVEGGVENRPKVNKPSKQDEPEYRRQNKLKDRHQQPTLKQLAQSRDEETTERRDNVASGTLTCHGNNLSVARRSATGEIARSKRARDLGFRRNPGERERSLGGRPSGGRAVRRTGEAKTPAAIKSNFVACAIRESCSQER